MIMKHNQGIVKGKWYEESVSTLRAMNFSSSFRHFCGLHLTDALTLQASGNVVHCDPLYFARVYDMLATLPFHTKLYRIVHMSMESTLQQPLMTPEEAARILNTNARNVLDWIRAGKLVGV